MEHEGQSDPGSSDTHAAQAERLADRVRETAKWLVASFAGIGTVLIAGSQLSSIGRLPVCVPSSIECARLWLALLGTIVALLAVGLAILATLKIMLPEAPTLGDLTRMEAADPKSPTVKFFADNPEYLGGFESFEEMRELRRDAVAKHALAVSQYDAAPSDEDASAVETDVDYWRAEVKSIDEVFRSVSSYALQETLRSEFLDVVRRRLSWAFVAAAAGIVLFAWAANPPEETSRPAVLRGADLRGVDLQGVSLEGADLTGADLSSTNLLGANLSGAKIKNVKWADTTCPDGVNSDQAGGTCAGHLSP